jgi:phosphoribosyl-ATP pyrophosphohydrolase
VLGPVACKKFAEEGAEVVSADVREALDALVN